MNISEIVKTAEHLYDMLNFHFYNDELPKAAITVSPDGGRGAYGWCSVDEIWRTKDGEGYREINITAEYLDRPFNQIAATMLHEMAHLYNIIHGIEDTSNNGYYHNTRFKATAEAHGLLIAKHKTYGWTITTLESETELWLREVYPDMAMDATRLGMILRGTQDGDESEGQGKAPKRGRPASKNRSIKYVCPDCGQSVRATKQVNIVCGDCGKPFEIA